MPRTATLREESVPLDERALIARILDGDRVAGRQLYEAHAPRVHRLVYRLCGDAELAQDFTQDEQRYDALFDAVGLKGDLGALVTRGRLQGDDNRLTERCMQWIAGIKAQFAGTPLTPQEPVPPPGALAFKMA